MSLKKPSSRAALGGREAPPVAPYREPNAISDAALEKYRDWLSDSVGPVVRAWSADAAARRFEAASAEFTQRTSDDLASQTYAAACPVGDLDHRLYRLRELTFEGDFSLLAGIHFRGQSTEYPFVGVFAQSRRLATSEVAAAHAALLNEFAVFSPRATWWWRPMGQSLPELDAVALDQHLVMGSLAEIRRAPAQPLPRGWTLRRLDSAREVEAAFADLYQSFHRARPELAASVPASPPEALEECAKARGLYACFAGAGLAGLVAAKPETQYAVDAWLMWDIVLARKHCGRGLAPVLQRAVLDRLDITRAPLVVGTIVATNLPSLRTALRVGRQVVGSWFFIRA